MSEEEGGISPSEGQRPSVDDDLIEPKGKPKIIRVLTVVAYTLTVSMAAILLSIYYVFVWDGHPTLARKGPVASPLKATNLEPPTLFNLTEKNEEIFELDGGNVTEKENVLVDVPYEPTAIPVREATTATGPEAAQDELEPAWPEFRGNFTAEKLEIKSPLIQKLIFKNALD